MERQQDRSIGDLFADLSRETSTLVRKEVELAKTEMTNTAKDVGKNVGALAIGGAVAYAGVLALVYGIIIALGDLLNNLWVSAFIVGAVIVVIGYMMIQKGLSALKKLDPVPHHTVETLKEDKEWAKDQIR